MEIKINNMDDFDYRDKTVLVRLDVNSPLDSKTKAIVNENRIKKSIPTIKKVIEKGGKLVIIAHQGDTLDYQNLIPMEEHAKKLSEYSGVKIKYIDDVCGPAAIEAVKNVKAGEGVFLGNLRYLCEEISTFENDVKLRPAQMLNTFIVRKLAPICDFYVNDAFAAAHRNCPSMIAFQELLPTAAGTLLFTEYEALSKVLTNAEKPAVFLLGGAKISDAFGMMQTVLENGTADKIVTSGVTGVIMAIASGVEVGSAYSRWLFDRNLLTFVEPAREYLEDYPGKIEVPSDFAIEEDGKRRNVDMSELPIDKGMLMDIGERTIARYREIILSAKTLFVNGPAGVYEMSIFEEGTREMWKAIAESSAYSVIGGGDTVSAAGKYIDLADISYVCTAGGAMVRFMSGKKLPLITAMEKCFNKDYSAIEMILKNRMV